MPPDQKPHGPLGKRAEYPGPTDTALHLIYTHADPLTRGSWIRTLHIIRTQLGTDAHPPLLQHKATLP